MEVLTRIAEEKYHKLNLNLSTAVNKLFDEHLI
jgi:hypothetical protein